MKITKTNKNYQEFHQEFKQTIKSAVLKKNNINSDLESKINASLRVSKLRFIVNAEYTFGKVSFQSLISENEIQIQKKKYYEK